MEEVHPAGLPVETFSRAFQVLAPENRMITGLPESAPVKRKAGITEGATDTRVIP